MQTEMLRKLDAGLLSLVTDAGLDRTDKLPLFIRAHDGELDRVIAEVDRAGGVVRHELRRFNAVAAWVPIQVAEDLAKLPFVERVELSQRVSLA
jgi:hypothetical protein